MYVLVVHILQFYEPDELTTVSRSRILLQPKECYVSSISS